MNLKAYIQSQWVIATFSLYFIYSLTNITLAQGNNEFVKVKGTQFQIGEKPYYFVGANFWYGMNLGIKSAPGNRERLIRELDALQKIGVNNLRIMALTEGPDSEPYRISPAVQTSAGVFREDLLEGLDFLLVEMGKRKMYAVICLGNFWHWSGGLGQYLIWSGDAKSIPNPPPNPGGSWESYQKFTSKFYSTPKAVDLYWGAVKHVVGRVNTITLKNYSSDPFIMSWQLGNEPRGVANVKDFNVWIDSTAAIIKALDKNHLVNVGSEGHVPYPNHAGNHFFDNHNGKNIDYTTAHIWIENWEWYDPKNHDKTYPSAVSKMKNYIKIHTDAAKKIGKPIVFEEFGIARDNGNFDPKASIKNRDVYYQQFFEEVYQLAAAKTPVAGVNFWAWGGEGRPRAPKEFWKPGDPWIGDPPHESQGWYSVYNSDTTTHAIIKNYNSKMAGIK